MAVFDLLIEFIEIELRPTIDSHSSINGNIYIQSRIPNYTFNVIYLAKELISKSSGHVKAKQRLSQISIQFMVKPLFIIYCT